MITIKKGNHTLQVSKNTYETMFKIMGYTIVDEKEEAKKEASSTNDNIQTSDIEKNTIIDADKTNQDKELDDFCNEHYKLKIENGYIRIYELDEQNNEKLLKSTEISSEYLTKSRNLNASVVVFNAATVLKYSGSSSFKTMCCKFYWLSAISTHISLGLFGSWNVVLFFLELPKLPTLYSFGYGFAT